MKYSIILGILLLFVACNTQTTTTTSPDPIEEITNNQTTIETKTKEPTCVDTDGKDYQTKGMVKFKGETYTDECFEEKRLKEYICEEGVLEIDLEYCQDGICEDGKCIKQAIDKFGCTETDGGSVLNVSGSATDANNNTETDYCENGQIFEAYCDINGVVKVRGYKCDLCEQGRCIKQEIEEEINCIDTDGGVQFEILGTVTDAYNRVRNDTCNGPRILEEWVCDTHGFAKAKYKNCDCLDGRCLPVIG